MTVILVLGMLVAFLLIDWLKTPVPHTVRIETSPGYSWDSRLGALAQDGGEPVSSESGDSTNNG